MHGNRVCDVCGDIPKGSTMHHRAPLGTFHCISCLCEECPMPVLHVAFQERVTEMLKEFKEEIKPLRKEADAGRGSYEDYDETYNEWLEGLHALVSEFFDEEK